MTPRFTLNATHRILTLAAFSIAPLVLGAKGCGIAVIGEECGGLQGVACDDGQFCDFEPEAACGAADQTGTCREIPEFCTLQLDPVCGCDDQTYGNACEANAAGVSVASEGPCEGGVGATCGGIAGAACADGLFCNFPVEAQCGAADQTGTCEAPPEVCTDQFDPVCGCDDQTYGNACEASAAGVSVASEGPCEPPSSDTCGGITGAGCGDDEFCNFPIEAQCGAADQTGTCAFIPDACDAIFAPVCGCDDQTYGNACEAAAAGVSVASEGECDGGSGGNACGGLLGLDCAEGEFCNFPIEAQCGAADQTGTCEPLAEFCTLELNPVCGCDDVTYGNACAASQAGVSVASEGTCEGGSGGTECGGLLGLPCAEGQFCDFAPNAFCGAADQTGTCRDVPEFCTEQFDPVCGCDDVTYGNACAANAAGVAVAAPGECP